MQGKTTSRRAVLAAIGAGTVTALAGCIGGTNNSDSSPTEDTETTESTPNSTETDTETEQTTTQNKLQQQLETVRSATEKYADPKAALQDGFKFGGPYVPGMGWHFTHPERLQAAAKNGLNLEKPPMLTYLDNDHTDGLELAAVEFGVPKQAVDETPDLFADENADATEEWHEHGAATHVFANDNGKQDKPSNISFDVLTTKEHWTEFSPPDKNLAAGDTVALNWGTAHGKEGETTKRVADIVSTHPGLHTLHTWVHKENPDGVFAPVHPDFAGGHSH